MIECHPIAPGPAGRAEWLAWRRQDITASVAGALFGCDMPDRDLTVLRLWAEHRGTEFPEKPDNKFMRRGRKLERLVGEEVEELQPAWKVEPVGAYYRDADLRLGATPDFFVLGDARGRGVLQAKTAGSQVIASKWDEGRVPPDWILWQVRTEMLLTDAAFGVIAALDPFTWDCHIIEVERDAEAELLLATMVRKFWLMVAQGVEPEPDFARDAAAVRALTARAVPGAVRDLAGNNELPELLARRAHFMEQVKYFEARCEAIETELRYLMGEAEQATGLPGWRITYKTEHRKEYTVKARSGRVLRIYDKREEGDK
jgi:predicted phage-related endonuclease